MSECVVRMEMPEGCWDCPCVNGEYGYCQADEEKRQIKDPNERPSWCPTICQLPDGHGRLIDADSMEKEVCGGCEHGEHKYANCIDCALANAPTIVPADTAERSET